MRSNPSPPAVPSSREPHPAMGAERTARAAVLELGVPVELVEVIAQRAAAIVAEKIVVTSAPWLDTKGAAAHLACSTARIHDLVQTGGLCPRRDGRRLLFRPADLDAYVESSA
jgi:hypothetical protein